MELDVKVICLIIVLIAYEFMIRRSKLAFNKWATLGIFTAFSYATISSSLSSDKDLKTFAIYVLIIFFKAIVLTAIYRGARQTYFKLPDKSKKYLYGECGIIVIILALFSYQLFPTWNSQTSPFPTLIPGPKMTEEFLSKMRHEFIGDAIFVGFVILCLYIIIRNWIYLKIAERKNR